MRVTITTIRSDRSRTTVWSMISFGDWILSRSVIIMLVAAVITKGTRGRPIYNNSEVWIFRPSRRRLVYISVCRYTHILIGYAAARFCQRRSNKSQCFHSFPSEPFAGVLTATYGVVTYSVIIQQTRLWISQPSVLPRGNAASQSLRNK